MFEVPNHLTNLVNLLGCGVLVVLLLMLFFLILEVGFLAIEFFVDLMTLIGWAAYHGVRWVQTARWRK